MDNTLTYNPTEGEEQELNEEELDSLKVGEALEQEQAELLAGKFKSAEDLEKAYKELESKLDRPRNEDEGEPEEEENEGEEEDEDLPSDLLERLWEEAFEDGDYSEELVEALSELDPTDVAQMYLDYREKVEAEGAGRQMDEDDIETLQGMVGGKEEYGEMMRWAGENLDQDEINLFDSVMANGDPAAAFFAVQSLAYRYGDAAGREGEMITGRQSRSEADVFKSQAQVISAMKDPRYDTDEAYRIEVMEKLERSPVTF